MKSQKTISTSKKLTHTILRHLEQHLKTFHLEYGIDEDDEFSSDDLDMNQSRINNIKITPLKSKFRIEINKDTDRYSYHHLKATIHEQQLLALLKGDFIRTKNHDYDEIIFRFIIQFTNKTKRR